jgi:hypothetical protein
MAHLSARHRLSARRRKCPRRSRYRVERDTTSAQEKVRGDHDEGGARQPEGDRRHDVENVAGHVDDLMSAGRDPRGRRPGGSRSRGRFVLARRRARPCQGAGTAAAFLSARAAGRKGRCIRKQAEGGRGSSS